MNRSPGLAEKYLALGVAAATLLVLGATACGGANNNCVSPARNSLEFAGDPKAVQNDPNTWTEGVEADTTIPAGAKALRVGFTDPGGFWHDSEWISADSARFIGLSIGHISVRFKTQIEAAKGSALCNKPPDTAFKRAPYPTLLYEGATIPSKWHAESSH